jgi:3,4-dihydroxy 2-butanone 4-phosphate synthase/GTP cyclohydrolase II
MTERNTEELSTAFTVSIDAQRRFGVTTGISATDRATTIHVAINPTTVPADLRRPGHIFPLRARPGGVLQRVGQTEASVDLARLAGLNPAGVICEILNADGSMARRTQLHHIAEQHGLTFVTVAQLVAYRLRTEQLVHRVAEARIPTEFGEFTMIGYRNDVDRAEHVALVYGDIAGEPNILVRMHSKCLTGDVFGSQRCDCGPQLREAVERIANAGGYLLYLRQEGRGIGLYAKLDAYALQDSGLDTYEANRALGRGDDERDYTAAAQMLHAVGATRIDLLSNNPDKAAQLEGLGIGIRRRVPTGVHVSTNNVNYLRAKVSHTQHTLVLPISV